MNKAHPARGPPSPFDFNGFDDLNAFNEGDAHFNAFNDKEQND